MIWKPFTGEIKPEVGNLGQYFAFPRDTVRHDAVERRDSICSNKKEGLPEIKDLADFAGL
jgi:hypothetical protein